MGHCVYVNGEFLPRETATVSVLDGGLRHGYGLFETMPVYHAVPFRLKDHVWRLLSAAQRLTIRAPLSAGGIESAARELISRNGISSATLRILLTCGDGTAATLIVDTGEPRAIAPEQYTRGMDLAISSIQCNATSPLAGMKTLNYLENILAREEARKAGCDEALILSTEQFVAEGATSNIFFVIDGAILTPSLDVGVLPGITRKLVLEICGGLGVPVREEVFTLVDILSAQEVFITSSLLGIMPVATIDSKAFGSACPGEVTARLSTAYNDLVRTECGGQ